jgi:hypothetical protein
VASLSPDLAQRPVQETEIAVVGVSHMNPKNRGVVVVTVCPSPPSGPSLPNRPAHGAEERLATGRRSLLETNRRKIRTDAPTAHTRTSSDRPSSREAWGRWHAAAVEPVRRYFRRAQQAIGDPAQRRNRPGAGTRDPCDVWTSGSLGQRRVLDCGPASGPGAFTRHRAADAGRRLTVDGARRPIASAHHDGQKRSAGWSVALDGSPLHHPQLPFRPGGIRRHTVPLAAPTPEVTSFRPESRALSERISRLRGNRRRNTCVNAVGPAQ